MQTFQKIAGALCAAVLSTSAIAYPPRPEIAVRSAGLRALS